MTYTPGPWEVKGPIHGYDWSVFKAGSKLAIADICSIGGALEKSKANARLIAAAPELLAALKDALPILYWELEKHGVDPVRRYQQAKMAILHAEGQAGEVHLL